MKHLDAEEFRKYGHEVVDFIADYYKTIDSYPVRSAIQVKPLTFLLFLSLFKILLSARPPYVLKFKFETIAMELATHINNALHQTFL